MERLTYWDTKGLHPYDYIWQRLLWKIKSGEKK